MSSVDFSVEFVKSSNASSGDIAAVFYGLDPIPGQLDHTIKTLAEESDVVVYGMDRNVIYGADPARLPILVDDLHVDLMDKIDRYDRVRTVGVSLGALLAYNANNRLLDTGETEVQPAIYAAAGVNLAKNLTHHPIYYPVKKKFKEAGFGQTELADQWKGVDLNELNLPQNGTKIVGVLTRLDQYVPYPWVMQNMKMWQERTDVRLDIEKTWKFGHTAAIVAFDSGMRELLERANDMRPNT